MNFSSINVSQARTKFDKPKQSALNINLCVVNMETKAKLAPKRRRTEWHDIEYGHSITLIVRQVAIDIPCPF